MRWDGRREKDPCLEGAQTAQTTAESCLRCTSVYNFHLVTFQYNTVQLHKYCTGILCLLLSRAHSQQLRDLSSFLYLCVSWLHCFFWWRRSRLPQKSLAKAPFSSQLVSFSAPCSSPPQWATGKHFEPRGNYANASGLPSLCSLLSHTHLRHQIWCVFGVCVCDGYGLCVVCVYVTGRERAEYHLDDLRKLLLLGLWPNSSVAEQRSAKGCCGAKCHAKRHSSTVLSAWGTSSS